MAALHGRVVNPHHPTLHDWALQPFHVLRALPQGTDELDEGSAQFQRYPYSVSPSGLLAPPEVEWNDLPPKIYIVMGLVFVLWWVGIEVSSWAFNQAARTLQIAMAYLGTFTGVYDGATGASPQEMQQAVISMIQVLCNNPLGGSKFAPLQKIIPFLENFDFYATLQEVALTVSTIQTNLTRIQATATILATLVMILTFATLIIELPKYLRLARRGGVTVVDPRRMAQSPLEAAFLLRTHHANLLDADRYVGLQTMQCVLQMLMVFSVTVLLYVLLLNNLVQAVINAILDEIFTAAFVSIVVFFLFSHYVVNYVMVRRLTILRNALYLPWCVLASLWFIFNAIFHTVLRMILGLLAQMFTFARVDLGILPLPLLMGDFAHISFFSLVVVHSRYANPVVWVAASWLMLEAKKKSLARSGTLDVGTKGPTDIAVELAKSTWLPHMRNTVIILGLTQERVPDAKLEEAFEGLSTKNEKTTLTSPVLFEQRRSFTTASLTGSSDAIMALIENSSGSIQAGGVPVRRCNPERVARRWWLLWLLHQNPSIRAFRKFRLPSFNVAAKHKASEGNYHGSPAQDGAKDMSSAYTPTGGLTDDKVNEATNHS